MYKNKCGCLTQIGQYFWIAAMTLLSFCLLQGSVRAQEAICAEVKIVIDQKLSFERQAFDAKMVINNGLDSQVVENVNVELLFTDANGQPVVATQDPNASNATFFYRTDSLSGIASTEGNGRVEPKSSAEVHWMIIPAAGSVDSNSALYYVGAKVSYTLDGIQTEVEVTPEYIIVKPLPKLSLDYFLPADVYADDPFTDEVEPQVPFTLGVRVSNSGFGDSPNTVIESAQPKIVENKQNLLVGFDILGSYISDVPAGKSLLLNFDTIAAGTAKVGRWRMVTTLSGRFIEFNARFTHADELGGALTALLERVTTHTLIHDVKVDLPGRDTIRDFLALDSDSYRVYESDGIDTEVIDRSQEAQLVNRSDKGVVKFTPVAGFVYAKMDEPYQGRAIPIKAVRSDGKVLPAENLWLSKRFNDNLTWSYYLNLFDVESTGEYVFEWAQEPKTKLSGKVYEDTNNNGMQDPNEQGIGAVGVTLSGIDDKGTYLSLVGYTNRSGVFAFNDLHSGIYSLEVASVASMNDGVAKAGGAGGNASPGKIKGIQLVSGIESEDYLFAKRYGSTINPEGATLSGSVYLDANNNGLFDENESGLDSVAVALSGTSYEGNVIYRETLTGALGSFTFSGLSHGLYSLAVQPIAGMTDGIATPGDAGGIATLGLIKDITLTEASNGQGYLLAKRSESEPDLRSDLVLSVYDSSKAKPAVNKEITLHWTVKNLGPDSAPETKLKIALPASVTLIKADSGYKDGVWRVGELLSQQSKTLRLTIVANDLSSDVLFSGVATSTRHDADNANNTATLLWKGRAAAKTDLQISFENSSTKSADERR